MKLSIFLCINCFPEGRKEAMRASKLCWWEWWVVVLVCKEVKNENVDTDL